MNIYHPFIFVQLPASYAVMFSSSESSSQGGDPSSTGSVTSFATTTAAAAVASVSRRRGFLLQQSPSAGGQSQSIDALAVLYSELVDALSLAVVQSAPHGAESHYSRIIRQLEAVDLRSAFVLTPSYSCKPFLADTET